MLWKALMAQITFLEGGGRFEDAPTGKGRPSPGDVIVLNDQGGNSINVETGDVSPTLRAETHGNLPVVCAGFSGGQRAKAGGIGYGYGLSPTLKGAASGTNQVPCVLAVHQNQCGEVRTGKVANTVNTNGNASGKNAPLVAVFENHGQDSRITGPLEVAPTISQKFGTGGNNVPLVASFTPTGFAQYAEGVGTLKANGGDLGGGSETLVAVGIDEEVNALEEKMGTLIAHASGGMREYVATFTAQGHAVRRLTPKECERLQGFPDGWTAYGHDGRPISDTQRYKALGNSVAIPCVEFVMGNIAKIMEAE